MVDNDPVSEPLSPWHKRILVGASLVMVAAPLPPVTFTFANPSIASAFGIGGRDVMVAFAATTLTNAVSMIVLGPRTARWGARRTIVIGGSWAALMLLAFSFAQSLWQLSLAAAGLGLTVGLATGMSATIVVNHWFTARRGTAVGLISAFSGATGLVLGLVLPPVIAAAGWPWAYRTSALLMVLLAVLPGILLLRSEPADVGQQPYGGPEHHLSVDGDLIPGLSLRQAVRTPHLWLLAGAFVLVAACQSMLQHVARLAALAHLDLRMVGLVLAVQAVAMVAAQPVVGWAADRFGVLATSVTCLAAQAAGFVILMVSADVLSFTLALILFGAGVSVVTVLVPVLITQVFGPHDLRAILGPMMGTLPAGLALGAPLWGADYDATGGFGLGLWLAVAASAVAAVTIAWVVRTASALRRAAAADSGIAAG